MALINCPECGKKVSTTASSCPHCGFRHHWEEKSKEIAKVEKEYVYQFHTIFNRIQDKLFSLNGIFIAAFLVLGTFPSDSPVIKFWTVLFPTANLLLLIIVEFRQVRIHYFAIEELKNWGLKEDIKFDTMISFQSFLTLISILTTIAVIVYLGVRVYCYIN